MKEENKNDDLVYLDTYVLQQDMRIRLPKSILNNMNAKKGITCFSIYYSHNKNELILKIDSKKSEVKNGQ